MGNLADKFDTFTDSLGSLLLLLIFVLLLLLGAGLMVNAFRDFKDTNERVANAMEAASKQLGSRTKKRIVKIKDTSNEVYLEQLKTRSKSALDSNTISFLFQIFALSLVSAGVYLLSRSRRNLRKAEVTTRKIASVGNKVGPFVTNAPFSSALGSHIIVALQECRHLRSMRTKTRKSSFMAVVLESLTQLLRWLETGRRNSMGLERSQHDIFLDQVCMIERNLTGIKGAEELVSLSRECMRILKEGEFVERYEKQLQEICRQA
jgi:flagellar biogenesis protein FliO